MKKLIKSTLNESTLLFFIVAFLLCSCSGKKESNMPILKIGESYLEVPGGKIWYKITGTGTGIPVVLLHGGPGFSSYYLKPFEELGNDRQVIRYDQLGGGKSDRVYDTTMFTINHFVNELELLRQSLGVSRWHVFGHSWGTILAVEYYRVYPEKVVSLILGSAALNMSIWEKHANELLTSLPESLQQAIKQAELTGDFNDSLYQVANNEFYNLYMFRNPILEDLDSMFAAYNENIYTYMQGPSEFTITGTLKGYDATSFLSKIMVPTLFTVGEFDEAGPEIIKGYADKVLNSRYVVFPGAAHLTSWDARDENVRIVREFLYSVDSLNNQQ
jgi:proline iminopeptidase